jgi:hypothetical protein
MSYSGENNWQYGINNNEDAMSARRILTVTKKGHCLLD